MELTNIKEETGKKKRTSKFAMLAGAALIASTLFAGTALASTNPVNDSSDKQPAKKQLMLSIKNGSGDPIDISGSSPEMIKAQVDSLVEAGKLSKEEADKILSSDNPAMNLSDSKPAGNQMMLVIKDDSGDQIKLSGTSPEMIKSQVQALLAEGKISQQTADKILNGLPNLPSKE